MIGFDASFGRRGLWKQDLEHAPGNAHHTLIFSTPMPNSTTERWRFHRASGGKRKNIGLLGCSTNVLSNVSQMPRGVESFAIGKRNRDRVRRVVPRGGASRRPARELLSPPTEGTHFVPTYGEIVS